MSAGKPDAMTREIQKAVAEAPAALEAALKSAGKVDVLAILDLIAQLPTHPPKDERNLRALEVAKLNAPNVRAAVAELIGTVSHVLVYSSMSQQTRDSLRAALARIGGGP